MASQLPSRADIHSVVEIVNGMKVRDLTAVCVANGLTKSGVKAELQQRIVLGQLLPSQRQKPRHTMPFLTPGRTRSKDVSDGRDETDNHLKQPLLKERETLKNSSPSDAAS
jgi:hypothetical protein